MRLSRPSPIGAVISGVLLMVAPLGAAKEQDKSCSVSQTHPTSLESGEALLGLGSSVLATGELAQALGDAQRSKDPHRIATAEGALGSALHATGDLAEARSHLTASVLIAESINDYGLAIRSQNNLGNVLFAQGLDQEALKAFESAALKAASIGDRRLLARVSVNAARVQAAVGQTDKANGNLAAVLAEPQADPLDLIAAGRIAAHSGLPESDLFAEKSYKRASNAAHQAGDLRSSSLANGYLGELLLKLNRDAESETATNVAIFEAQALQANDLLYKWNWTLGRLKKATGDRDAALIAYRHAFDEVQLIRNDILVTYEEGRSSFNATLGDLYREYADLLLGAADTTTAHSDAQYELLRQTRSVIESLKIAEIRDYFRDQCLDASESRIRKIDKLDEKTAVIYPIVLANRTEVLVFFSDDSAAAFKSNVAAEVLYNTVRSFRRLLVTRSSLEYVEPARELYRWLISQTLPELRRRDIKTLVWVPDSILRTVPVAALTPDGRNFVIDEYAVATAPGLSLIDPIPLTGAGQATTLLAGMTEARLGYSGLPNVEQELSNIGKVEATGAILKNENFRVDTLSKEFDNTPYRIVHIASHGVFDSDPSKSFVLAWDGKITLDRLEQTLKRNDRPNNPLELLVLSACETAKGDDRAALGLAGIAIKAGARSALASLWAVNDVATSDMIPDFYKELRTVGISKATALQNAQLSIRRDPRFDHPYYWSSFLLIGNWL